MTETEQAEVKARVEKLVAEFGKQASQLEARVTELQDEVERKNRALEGFMAENEALKDELGGRTTKTLTSNGQNRNAKPGEPVRLPFGEGIEAKIQRWKTGGGGAA